MQELKTKAKATWATGSYNDIAQVLAPGSYHLVREAGIRSGDAVLDVATGTGVTAIAARRAGAKVTGLDLTPELLAHAVEEARAAGLGDIQWKEGDAEALPFPDASFDVVVSSFGHMFAPRPDVVTGELLRVLKPGGRLAFLTHRKGNVATAFFAAMAKHVPPPPNGPPSVFLWGDTAVIRDRLGDRLKDVRFEEGAVEFPTLSPGHFWRLFSTKYGPTMRALAALGDDAKRAALGRDFVEAVTPYWSDGVTEMAYVITVGVKK